MKHRCKKNVQKFDADEQTKRVILDIYATVCFLLNFIRIFDNAFWGDEGWTIRLANSSIPEMLRNTAENQHPPLYYLIVKLFRMIGGNYGPVYHLPSIIPYGILIILGVSIVRKRFGYIASFIFVTFSSFTTAALTYNVEVRMYSWASLFVFLTWLSVYDILEYNRFQSWAVFTIFSVLAAYTHYYALLAVAFLYLGLLIRTLFIVRTKDALKKMFLSIAAAVAAYFPWLTVMLKSVHDTVGSDYWIQTEPKLRYMFTFLFESKWMVLIAGIIAVAYFIRQKKKEQRDQTILTLMLLGLFSFAGVIAVSEAVSILFHPILLARYLFTISSMVWLMLGIAISGLKYRKQVFAFVLIAAMLFCIPAYVKLFSYDYQLNQDTAAFEQNVLIKNNDVILTNRSHFDWTLLDYYYPGTPHALLENAEADNITEKAKSLAKGQGEEGIWLFWSDPLTEDDAASLEATGYNTEQYYFGRLGNGEKLYVYELR